MLGSFLGGGGIAARMKLKGARVANSLKGQALIANGFEAAASKLAAH